MHEDFADAEIFLFHFVLKQLNDVEHGFLVQFHRVTTPFISAMATTAASLSVTICSA